MWTRFPAKIRGPLYRVFKWQYAGICLLTLITLILHFIIIEQPATEIFDEGHYVSEARSVIAGEGATPFDHPPLAKLFIISGIRLFGDTPFGWRFFSVVFGTISVVLFYFICRKLDMPRGAPFLATTVFAFENLSFVQASLAMLDVYTVTFMLGAFLLYLQRHSFTSGFSLALSTLAKLTGALSFFSLFTDWLLDRKRKLQALITLTSSALISFLLLFTGLTWALFGRLSNPIAQIKSLLTQTTSLTFAFGYQPAASKPWDWLLQPMSIFYSHDPQYIAILSLTVWVVIFPVLAYMVWETMKDNRASRFGLAWFTGTYLLLVALVLLTDRVSFVYYFYPSIGAICIGIGIILAKLFEFGRNNISSNRGKAALITASGYLTLHIMVFILFSPIAVPFIWWLPL